MAKSAPTFKEIIKDIKAGRFAPVYILMGDEPYYIDRITDALEANVVDETDKDFNTFIFYGAETSPELVVASAQQLPMMSERQLVILKEAQAMTHAKTALEKLEGYMNHVNPQTVLAIIYKGDTLTATSKMVKSADKNGAVIFKSMRLRDYQISAPVKEYCAARKVRIDEHTIQLLGEYVGCSLESIFSSIDKIIISKGAKMSDITEADIAANIGQSKDYNVFELTKAVGERNYRKAQTIIKYFRDNPKSVPTVMISPALFNYFVRLTSGHFSADKSDGGLSVAMGCRNSFALREMKGAMRNYGPMQCLRAISAIRDFDCRSKGIGSMQNEHELLRELLFYIFTC